MTRRIPLALILACLVTFGLFWTMQALIGVSGELQEGTSRPSIDFVRLRKDSQLKSPVKAFMSRARLQTIDPGASPLQAANMMVKHDIGRLPVVEDGRIIGIVTRTDTMRYFYDLMPD